MRTAIPAAAQRTGTGSGVSALKQARVFLYVFYRPSRHALARREMRPFVGTFLASMRGTATTMLACEKRWECHGIRLAKETVRKLLTDAGL
ncbi:hypothetical protein BamIOP4010DRAFT_2507 [Burkholderia ambifaria IOP40-10]|uniref:Uncharacterized protein n=1 Tax=Burkholderia ambifaria IOP40-10 TaxID=396596 RepID=B1FEP7_9BURK|nr:hypothetical protein BamIOP4010DRAFT_2507 [Burkholderia ambifaria IOP40-10]